MKGTATLAEIYPNADYESVLVDAVARNSLISLSDLCLSFPEDAGSGISRVCRNLDRLPITCTSTYGSAGLLSLFDVYADGVDCEHGAGTWPLEFRSRISKRSGNRPYWGRIHFFSILQNISPYLVLLCLVLIIPLLVLSSTLRKRGSSNESGTYVRKQG